MLEGSSAKAPGAGGGGSGTDIPGGYGGDGGDGGELVTGWLSVDEFEDLEIRVGNGGLNGQDGEDSVVIARDAEGAEVHRLVASGGRAGKSGAARWDEAEGPALRVSSMLLVNHAEIHDGLVSMLGGGWTAILLETLPTTIELPMVLMVEPTRLGERETELLIQALDEDRTLRSESRLQLRINPARLPDRFPIALNLPPAEVAEEGTWTIRVQSGGMELASLDLSVRLKTNRQ